MEKNDVPVLVWTQLCHRQPSHHHHSKSTELNIINELFAIKSMTYTFDCFLGIIVVALLTITLLFSPTALTYVTVHRFHLFFFIESKFIDFLTSVVPVVFA